MLYTYVLTHLAQLHTWWVGFYGISILVGYLMPNPDHTYMSSSSSSCRAGSTDITHICNGEKLKNKIIQSEEFIVKESWGYNVSVLINDHQDLEKITSSVRSTTDVKWNTKKREEIYTE